MLSFAKQLDPSDCRLWLGASFWAKSCLRAIGRLSWTNRWRRLDILGTTMSSSDSILGPNNE